MQIEFVQLVNKILQYLLRSNILIMKDINKLSFSNK
jgi:hypothetical protein